MASRSQLYYWFIFVFVSLIFCTLLDIGFKLQSVGKQTNYWSIITPSITIIARRIKGMSQPIFYQGQFIDIAIMIVILLIMLLVFWPTKDLFISYRNYESIKIIFQINDF